MEKGVGVHMVACRIAAYQSYAVAISSVVQTPAIILTGHTTQRDSLISIPLHLS
jgi:hypothetical protein